MRKCNACRGIYFEFQADGLRYFHSCPPVLLIRVDRTGEEMFVPAAAMQLGDVPLDKDGNAIELKALVADDAAQVLPDTMYLNRPNHRDENVIANGPNQGKPIAEWIDGPGFDVLEEPAADDPEVIPVVWT